ncbi:hypothetical protein L2E82_17197 [Cichorium intybus]|uniref:Uncharacterized protein n=1 Tax=Cichorium intybus TaxID=13427 RepID=A0ACB9F8W2_CICIN|nr:hypothetical protein L2E82_17197 [Cichorium intybus]
MSMEGLVIDCHTVDQWEEQFQKHIGFDRLVVVNFTAPWLGPCVAIAPYFAQFSKMMRHVTFLEVNVSELESIVQKYSVVAMPTFVFFKNGEIVDKILDADKYQLRACIEKHATLNLVSANVV